jgi:hypothetical protein
MGAGRQLAGVVAEQFSHCKTGFFMASHAPRAAQGKLRIRTPNPTDKLMGIATANNRSPPLSAAPSTLTNKLILTATHSTAHQKIQSPSL